MHGNGNGTPYSACLFDFAEEHNVHFSSPAETAETEFARYLDNRDCTKSPLLFFKGREATFPRMFQIVPQILCAPGSTAAVERVFSVAGYILSPKRMSLTDENFENQLFANLNRHVLQVRSNKLKL